MIVGTPTPLTMVFLGSQPSIRLKLNHITTLTMVFLGALGLNTGDYRYTDTLNYGDSGIAYLSTLVIIGTPTPLTMVILGSQPLNRLKCNLLPALTMVILGSLTSQHW